MNLQLPNNQPQSPEERTMALMRNINKPIDPSFDSMGEINMPDYSQMFDKARQNRGVGEGTPDTQPEQTEYDGDFNTYINALANKFGVSQKFGNKSNMYKSGVHQGLDIRTPTNTELISPVEGDIRYGYDPDGYGKYVQITTPNGEVIQFSHLSDTSDIVKQLLKSETKKIKKGQAIGKTGGATTDPNRGLSTGAHVDITYKRGDKFINPLGGQI